MLAQLLALAGPWLWQPADVPQPAPPPLMQMLPQPANVRGWRTLPWTEPEAGYAWDSFGYRRPRIVILPCGEGYYPATGQPYLFLPTRDRP
jgi:hypothetical protein